MGEFGFSLTTVNWLRHAYERYKPRSIENHYLQSVPPLSIWPLLCMGLSHGTLVPEFTTHTHTHTCSRKTENVPPVPPPQELGFHNPPKEEPSTHLW